MFRGFVYQSESSAMFINNTGVTEKRSKFDLECSKRKDFDIRIKGLHTSSLQ